MDCASSSHASQNCWNVTKTISDTFTLHTGEGNHTVNSNNKHINMINIHKDKHLVISHDALCFPFFKLHGLFSVNTFLVCIESNYIWEK